MNCYILSITNTCQKECSYCVMAKWRNNPAYPDKWDFESLIEWLIQTGISEGDHVQLTGGEPLAHPDCLKLIQWLHDLGCKILLLTNGLNLGIWRKDFPNMKMILAKHDTPNDQFEIIKSYCLHYDRIDYSLHNSVHEEEGVSKPNTPLLEHGYEKTFLMTNSGDIYSNWCQTGIHGNSLGTIWNHNPVLFGTSCGICSFASSIYNELNGI